MPAYPQAASIQQGGTIVKVKSVSPRNINTLDRAPVLSTDGTNVAPGATTMMVAELYVPAPCWSTGASVFNGATAAGNSRYALFDASGNIVCSTAATAQSGADAYQAIAWASEYVSTPGVKTALVGKVFLPAGTYYLGFTASSTGTVNCVLFGGTGGAGEITIVAATALDTTSLTITPPTTFTASKGPYASLY